jgi:hypothetical protein
MYLSVAKFNVFKTLIVAIALWMFVLFSFYYSLDPELHRRDGIHMNKIAGFLSPKTEKYLDFDDEANESTKQPSIKKYSHSKKKHNKLKDYYSKYIVSPIPKKIIDELGLKNPGELGKPVVLRNVSDSIDKRIKAGWKRHEFNEFVSDLISVKRSLPDPRDDYCKRDNLYLPVDELPSTSVIIIFHNEAWSTLLRSVHSVLDRSPSHLIEEIILVDDCSDMSKLSNCINILYVVNSWRHSYFSQFI